VANREQLAALESEGLAEIQKLSDFYLGNAKLIRNILVKAGAAKQRSRLWSFFC